MEFVEQNLTYISVIAGAAIALYAVRVLREYERAVVFHLGRFLAVRGPGLILLIPIVQQMVRVDLRTRVLDVPTQDVISRDNVSVQVNAVIYYRVMDPEKAIVRVEHFHSATSQLAQTTLRSVLGQHQLDEMLSARDKLNAVIKKILDEHTEPWGIQVQNVEIKQVDIDQSMIRAIAKQAEAERVRRAKIISAEGEQQAAEKLLHAARIISGKPQALQLRYLTALHDIAGENNSTIVFPLPIELLEAFTGGKVKIESAEKSATTSKSATSKSPSTSRSPSASRTKT